MSYKDILVYLDPTPASASQLDIALQIAVVDGAHVTGVDASTDEAFLDDWRDAATNIESAFQAALQAANVAGEFLRRGRTGSFGAEFVIPVDLVIAPSPQTIANL